MFVAECSHVPGIRKMTCNPAACIVCRCREHQAVAARIRSSIIHRYLSSHPGMHAAGTKEENELKACRLAKVLVAARAFHNCIRPVASESVCVSLFLGSSNACVGLPTNSNPALPADSCGAPQQATQYCRPYKLTLFMCLDSSELSW